MYAHQLRIASRVGLGLGVAALVRSNSNSNSTTMSKPTRCETAQHQQQLRRPSSQEQTYFDHALDDREKDTAGFVGVFLDAASVKRVQNAVGGSLGRNAHALVQLHPEPGVKRSFAPLFGSKVRRFSDKVLVYDTLEIDGLTHPLSSLCKRDRPR